MMRDYPLIMGILVIGAVLTLLGNLLADISYAWQTHVFVSRTNMQNDFYEE